MYIKATKYKTLEKDFGKWPIKSTLITHIWLYKDDGTYIKFLAHNDNIIQKLLDTKIDITIPEIQDQIKEHEIDKIIPPSPEQLLF